MRGSIAVLVVVASCGLAQGQEIELPADMRAAGATALKEMAEGADASAMADAAYLAMQPHQWQPIASAPMDRQILLGRMTESGFEIALGSWEVVDEPPVLGGRWTTDKWWDTPTTHWMNIPQPVATQ